MKKEIKIKVGDKVLLKNRRGATWNVDGKMDKYMGKVVTVSNIDIVGDFNIEEDCDSKELMYYDKWWFKIDDIERIVNNEFKRNDLQFGDIVTTRNGERYVFADGHMHGEKDDYYIDCDCISITYDENLLYNKILVGCVSEYDIMKVERAGQVIYERVKEVKEMTIAEISEALGYEIKVVKERNDKLCA